ncbi:hypothetical protein HDU87_000561 [Geranomyces variabilis]|uniref:Uncharacterized protein n=1 Tax=Geranomyces variabilis TaxID=109894 RepID=A0AAD5XMA7_9FUNG|nr:hypothetical protein HDU87_000561 [Geranomyces variabilis]
MVLHHHNHRAALRWLLLLGGSRLLAVDAWLNRLHLGRDKSISDLFSYNYTIPCSASAGTTNISCALSIVGSPGSYIQPGTWVQDASVGSAVVCQIVSATESPLLPAAVTVSSGSQTLVSAHPVWFGNPTRASKNCSYTLVQQLSGTDDMSDFTLIKPSADKSDFCDATQTPRNTYADTVAWPAIQRYFSSSDTSVSSKTSKRFADCYKTCGQSSSVTKFRNKRCKYFALHFPVPFSTKPDTGNLYSGSVNPTQSGSTWSLQQACYAPGNTTQDCLNRQPSYLQLSKHFIQNVTSLNMTYDFFDDVHNPTSLFTEFAGMYAMSLQGQVNVWVDANVTEIGQGTAFGKSVEGVLVYNTGVTSVTFHLQVSPLASSSNNTQCSDFFTMMEKYVTLAAGKACGPGRQILPPLQCVLVQSNPGSSPLLPDREKISIVAGSVVMTVMEATSVNTMTSKGNVQMGLFQRLTGQDFSKLPVDPNIPILVPNLTISGGAFVLKVPLGTRPFSGPSRLGLTFRITRTLRSVGSKESVEQGMVTVQLPFYCGQFDTEGAPTLVARQYLNQFSTLENIFAVIRTRAWGQFANQQSMVPLYDVVSYNCEGAPLSNPGKIEHQLFLTAKSVVAVFQESGVGPANAVATARMASFANPNALASWAVAGEHLAVVRADLGLAVTAIPLHFTFLGVATQPVLPGAFRVVYTHPTGQMFLICIVSVHWKATATPAQLASDLLGLMATIEYINNAHGCSQWTVVLGDFNQEFAPQSLQSFAAMAQALRGFLDYDIKQAPTPSLWASSKFYDHFWSRITNHFPTLYFVCLFGPDTCFDVGAVFLSWNLDHFGVGQNPDPVQTYMAQYSGAMVASMQELGTQWGPNNPQTQNLIWRVPTHGANTYFGKQLFSRSIAYATNDPDDDTSVMSFDPVDCGVVRYGRAFTDPTTTRKSLLHCLFQVTDTRKAGPTTIGFSMVVSIHDYASAPSAPLSSGNAPSPDNIGALLEQFCNLHLATVDAKTRGDWACDFSGSRTNNFAAPTTRVPLVILGDWNSQYLNGAGLTTPARKQELAANIATSLNLKCPSVGVFIPGDIGAAPAGNTGCGAGSAGRVPFATTRAGGLYDLLFYCGTNWEIPANCNTPRTGAELTAETCAIPVQQPTAQVPFPPAIQVARISRPDYVVRDSKIDEYLEGLGTANEAICNAPTDSVDCAGSDVPCRLIALSKHLPVQARLSSASGLP